MITTATAALISTATDHDVIDAIAVLDESPEFDRKALNRFVGLAIPVVSVVITGAVLRAWSDTGHDWWWTLALALLGVGLLGGSALARNRYQNLGTSESLLIAALAPLAGNRCRQRHLDP